MAGLDASSRLAAPTLPGQLAATADLGVGDSAPPVGSARPPVIATRFYGLPALRVWFPEDPGDLAEHLRRTPVVTAMQCADGLARRCQSLTFHHRLFHTRLIELARSEAALWASLDRDCRRQIRKADGVPHRILHNQRLDEAFVFLNQFIARKRYRAPLSRQEWTRVVKHCDVSIIEGDSGIVVVRLILLSNRTRARALFSASIDPREDVAGQHVALLNRALVWFEICRYRRLGFRYLDVGGISVDRASPLYSINRFKNSFGGELVTEHIVHMSAWRFLRRLLEISSTLTSSHGEKPADAPVATAT
jgi:hypothetical protein